jgi:hypothetical protein
MNNNLSHSAYANSDLQRQNTQMQRLVYEQIRELTTRELARRRMLDYACYLNPTYVMKPFHKKIASAMDRIVSGELKRLMISMPPGHTKSEFSSVLLPSFLVGHYPDRRLIHSSYASSLTNDFSRKVRALIRDNMRFKALFPGVRLDPDRARIDDWNTSAGGNFYSVGVGGGVSGHRAHYFIIDDPLKEGDEKSPKILQDIYDWYTSAAQTRLFPNGAIVIVATRWDEYDLIGRLLDLAKQDPLADQWEYICLPALAEKDDPMGRQPGEALWPEEYPVQRLYAIRAASKRYFDALFMQQPRSSDVALFSREGFKTDWIVEMDFPPGVWCFDLALTETDLSDYSAVGRWQYDRDFGNLYVSNTRRYRKNWPKMKKLIKRMIRLFKNDLFVFPPDAMELMAVQELLAEMPEHASRIKTIERKELKGDKHSRASVLSDRCENGQVYVIKSRHSDLFIDEHVKFQGQHDDFVDMSSVATHHFQLHKLFDFAISKDAPKVSPLERQLMEMVQ